MKMLFNKIDNEIVHNTVLIEKRTTQPLYLYGSFTFISRNSLFLFRSTHFLFLDKKLDECPRMKTGALIEFKQQSALTNINTKPNSKEAIE